MRGSKRNPRRRAATSRSRAGGNATPRPVENDLRFRLGQIAAQEARDGRVVPANAARASRCIAACIACADARRLARGGEMRVGVAARRARSMSRSQSRNAVPELLRRRRAKADRVRHAGIDGDAFMRVIGRQVEHVARTERPLARSGESAPGSSAAARGCSDRSRCRADSASDGGRRPAAGTRRRNRNARRRRLPARRSSP